MQISTNHSTTPTELTALHERGVHFVLCRAADDGPKKAKRSEKRVVISGQELQAAEGK